VSERDYAELVARVAGARRFGMRLELDRVLGCLDRLDHPERAPALRVQIAGTNGKGSTSAFVESILRAAGLSTALFTSPHLLRLSERFRAGGEEVPAGELVDADREVERAAGELGIDLTFFERLTVMAAVAFARRRVEVAVYEVGMGGRLDATTALGAEVAAVTGVALDHQEHLGHRLEDIAREKAGVFAPGQSAVVGAAGEPEAVPILIEAARVRGVGTLVVVGPREVDAVTGPLGLAGSHQRQNAACALAVTDACAVRLGRPIDQAARAAGLAACRLPGRLERLSVDPLVIADGAHNPHAARALADALADLAPPGVRWIAVLGASRDKDAAGLVAPIAARVSAVVATASTHERALPPAELARVARGCTAAAVHEAPDLTSALALARSLAAPDGAILIAGSLFLVGDARGLLLGDAADPLPVFDPVR
jgi:dihydrofolate synthase / folylpolyglutamate synthase